MKVMTIDPDVSFFYAAVSEDNLINQLIYLPFTQLSSSIFSGIDAIHIEKIDGRNGFQDFTTRQKLEQNIEKIKQLSGRWCYFHFAGEYKGSVPKDIYVNRVFAALTTAEKVLVPLNRHRTDLLDCCGLNMTVTRRLSRGGVAIK